MSSEITNFSVGDDIDIERTITNIPTGQTITSATLECRELEASVTPFLTKEITNLLTANGQITDTGADGTGVVVFTLSEIDTALFNAGNWQYYSIRVDTNGAKTLTVERGRIKANLK